MLNQKLTSGLFPLFKKARTLFLSCLLFFFILNSCMVVRFDAHLATKGTRIEKEEVQPGPPIEVAEHSNTQIGAGVEIKAGPKIGEKTEILGVFGYDRYYYFVGNDDFIKLGLQARRNFNNEAYWIAIEGSYVKDWAHIKDIEDNPDVGYAGYVFNPMTRKLEYCRNRMATGWMVGALYGYRIKKIKSMNMNVFAGAYLMHLGDFKSQQDIKTKEDYFNLHFKAGVELALPYSIK